MRRLAVLCGILALLLAAGPAGDHTGHDQTETDSSFHAASSKRRRRMRS
jgi:hypothetical protein